MIIWRCLGLAFLLALVACKKDVNQNDDFEELTAVDQEKLVQEHERTNKALKEALAKFPSTGMVLYEINANQQVTNMRVVPSRTFDIDQYCIIRALLQSRDLTPVFSIEGVKVPCAKMKMKGKYISVPDEGSGKTTKKLEKEEFLDDKINVVFFFPATSQPYLVKYLAKIMRGSQKGPLVPQRCHDLDINLHVEAPASVGRKELIAAWDKQTKTFFQQLDKNYPYQCSFTKINDSLCVWTRTVDFRQGSAVKFDPQKSCVVHFERQELSKDNWGKIAKIVPQKSEELNFYLNKNPASKGKIEFSVPMKEFTTYYWVTEKDKRTIDYYAANSGKENGSFDPPSTWPKEELVPLRLLDLDQIFTAQTKEDVLKFWQLLTSNLAQWSDKGFRKNSMTYFPSYDIVWRNPDDKEVKQHNILQDIWRPNAKFPLKRINVRRSEDFSFDPQRQCVVAQALFWESQGMEYYVVDTPCDKINFTFRKTEGKDNFKVRYGLVDYDTGIRFRDNYAKVTVYGIIFPKKDQDAEEHEEVYKKYLAWAYCPTCSDKAGIFTKYPGLN